MPLSPLRPPPASIQHAQHGLHRGAVPAAPAQATRPSNPALRAATGESGFDPQARAASKPQLSLPVASTPPVQGDAKASATTGTQATGSVGSGAIDALFNKGSATFEKILGQLGATVQPVDDPTARLQSRSDQLGGMLTADPSLKDQVSRGDLQQAFELSKLFSSPDFFNSLNDLQKSAVNSFNNTTMMLCGADWPPPPTGRGGQLA